VGVWFWVGAGGTGGVATGFLAQPEATIASSATSATAA
jgi:hypothetical protein